MPGLTLPPAHTALLRAILRTYLGERAVRVYVFGSRARGDYRTDSDLDVLLDDQEEIPLRTLTMLKEAFEDSPLPFRVDVVRRTDLSPEFYQHISQDCLPLDLG